MGQLTMYCYQSGESLSPNWVKYSITSPGVNNPYLPSSPYIIDAVDRYWAEDVQILGAWQDWSDAVCVVYRRTVDPMMTLGCRLEFHTNSADGTIEGFARDVAVNLAEPIGTQIARSRRDQHGIVWVAVPEGRHTSESPIKVLQKIADR